MIIQNAGRFAIFLILPAVAVGKVVVDATDSLPWRLFWCVVLVAAVVLSTVCCMPKWKL